MEYNSVEFCNNLNEPLTKKDTDKTYMRRFELEIVNTKYPKEQWF
jgi:hypothetical protein